MKTRFALLVLCAALTALQAANPVPAARTPGGKGSWAGLVGVPGGIPNRTNIYQTIAAGSSFSTIQSALNSCPSNQVVKLAAGSYSGTSLTIPNGVTLRGSGPTATILNTSAEPNILIGNGNWWREYLSVSHGGLGPNPARHVNWTSGFAQGTTNIDVDALGDLQVGQLIFMDQLNDTNTSCWSHNSSCGNGACFAGIYTSVAYPSDGLDRIQHQINRVVAINGRTLTLSDPVYMPNWQFQLNPQIWWLGNSRTVNDVLQPTCFAGIEDLQVHVAVASTKDAIRIEDAYGCWVKNCDIWGQIGPEMYNVGFIHAKVSLRTEVNHCNLHDALWRYDIYGIDMDDTSGALVVDNYGTNIAGQFLTGIGVSGCAYAYNYCIDTQGLEQGNNGWFPPSEFVHGGFPNMCLFEGNHVPRSALGDIAWNGSGYMVNFRCRISGVDTVSGGLTYASSIITDGLTNRNHTTIGCLLGTAGHQTWYEDNCLPGMGACHDSGRVYFLDGWSQGGCYQAGDPFDPWVKTTHLRAYNWTSATATNNGIVPDGYVAADIPASLLYASKPAFFGSLNWPAYDPGTATAAALSPTNIPSGYRAIYAVDPPASETVGTPIFSPAGGTFTNVQQVAISSIGAQAIYYTTDNWVSVSNAYGAPISVSSTTTLKAQGRANGLTQSLIGSATYTFSSPESSSATKHGKGKSGKGKPGR